MYIDIYIHKYHMLYIGAREGRELMNIYILVLS